ncbi:MAG TPA: hypothetical protein VOA64_15010 [Candidatus Dormibacteraeota bacterium]|nr:hypothetical protein [Candidatus Dormibacteraeota bacterium]
MPAKLIPRSRRRRKMHCYRCSAIPEKLTGRSLGGGFYQTDVNKLLHVFWMQGYRASEILVFSGIARLMLSLAARRLVSALA